MVLYLIENKKNVNLGNEQYSLSKRVKTSPSMPNKLEIDVDVCFPTKSEVLQKRLAVDVSPVRLILDLT